MTIQSTHLTGTPENVTRAFERAFPLLEELDSLVSGNRYSHWRYAAQELAKSVDHYDASEDLEARIAYLMFHQQLDAADRWQADPDTDKLPNEPGEIASILLDLRSSADHLLYESKCTQSVRETLILFCNSVIRRFPGEISKLRET